MHLLDTDKITINVDLDDVLNSLSSHWKRLHYLETGEIIKFKTWDAHKHSIYGLDIFKYFDYDGFFYDVPIKKGATELITYLMNSADTFDFQILSSYSGIKKEKYKSIYKQKYEWLKFHFNEDIANRLNLICDSKGLYKVNIIIDDYQKNLIESVYSTTKILIRAEHNKKYSSLLLKKEYDLNALVCEHTNDVIPILTKIEESTRNINQFINFLK
jgi:5'(3')-deoxyribonucleotidase